MNRNPHSNEDHGGLVMGFGAPESNFDSRRRFWSLQPIFRESNIQTCQKTISFSASMCLRGQACSPIPHSKPHFRQWRPNDGPVQSSKKYFTRSFYFLQNFFPMASDPRKKITKAFLLIFFKIRCRILRIMAQLFTHHRLKNKKKKRFPLNSFGDH
jgi:hypothetical protein